MINIHGFLFLTLTLCCCDDVVKLKSLVDVSRSFVEALNRNIAHRRPAWRAETGSLILSSGIGLLISDHSSFSIPRGRSDFILTLEAIDRVTIDGRLVYASDRFEGDEIVFVDHYDNEYLLLVILQIS